MPRVLLRTLSCHRFGRRPGNGFALPIALGGSLLLLLSSGSLQLLALQSRVRMAEQQRQLQREDVLASAAQQQVAALATQANCLLAVDLSDWAAVAPSCGLGADQLASLQQGQVGGQGYRIAAYRPRQSAVAAPFHAELELQLIGDRPWRAAYRLGLAPAGEAAQQLRVTAVQELGLRGVRA
jgi:hypothetical protein